MKTAEIRELNSEQIGKKVGEFKEELLNLRFQNEINQLEGYHRMRYVRKNIARLKTILKERKN